MCSDLIVCVDAPCVCVVAEFGARRAELQWTLIVRHVDLEPVDVKWRLEDRRSGDIVAVRADCRLLAVMSFDPGMPPHCSTLEEFWTQTLMARKKAIDLDKIDEQALALPRLSDPELELEAFFGPFDAPAPDFEPFLFAHEQLDQPAEVDALFQDLLPDVQPLDGPDADVEPELHVGDLSAHEQLVDLDAPTGAGVGLLSYDYPFGVDEADVGALFDAVDASQPGFSPCKAPM